MEAHSLLYFLRQPHFSLYKVYVQRHLGQVVFLNPKVGSTALREALVAAMQEQGIAPMRGRLWPMNTTRRYLTAQLRDYAHAFANPERYQFHCFVRNPYARVLSAWNDKLVKGFHAPEYPRSMRKLVPKLRQFARDHGLPGEDASAPLPFSTFVSFLESQAEGERNQHWDTQTSVLCAETVEYHHVHKMETGFVSGATHILEPLGVSKQWVADKLSRPANASGKLPSNPLDSALAERVYRLYEKDFLRFGYERDSWQTL